jgi:hypothetical protein
MPISSPCHLEPATARLLAPCGCAHPTDFPSSDANSVNQCFRCICPNLVASEGEVGDGPPADGERDDDTDVKIMAES